MVVDLQEWDCHPWSCDMWCQPCPFNPSIMSQIKGIDSVTFNTRKQSYEKWLEFFQVVWFWSNSSLQEKHPHIQFGDRFRDIVVQFSQLCWTSLDVCSQCWCHLFFSSDEWKPELWRWLEWAVWMRIWVLRMWVNVPQKGEVLSVLALFIPESICCCGEFSGTEMKK